MDDLLEHEEVGGSGGMLASGIRDGSRFVLSLRWFRMRESGSATSGSTVAMVGVAEKCGRRSRGPVLAVSCLIDGGEAAVLSAGWPKSRSSATWRAVFAGRLLLDGEAAEHGGADAVEGFVRDAGGGDFRDLGKHFQAGEVRLFGRGGEVEGEEPGVVAEELGGADLIGEAEFLADAGEKRAGHVRGVFLDHGERVAVRAADGAAGEADGEHGLFFRQAHDEVRRRGRGCRMARATGFRRAGRTRFRAMRSSAAAGSKSPAMASVMLAALKWRA